MTAFRESTAYDGMSSVSEQRPNSRSGSMLVVAVQGTVTEGSYDSVFWIKLSMAVVCGALAMVQGAKG